MVEYNTYKLPEGWIWTTVGELGIVTSGGTPSTRNPDFWGDEIAWITPADLSNYHEMYISKGSRNISKLGLDYSSATVLPKGSVLFSSRAPIGYVAIAKNEIATNQGFKNLIVSKYLCAEYIYYYFKTIKPLAERIASGTTFLELSAQKFSQIPIPLAPLNEQYRIIAKVEEFFSELDHAEEGLKKAKQQLEIYRQVLLTSVFEGKSISENTEPKSNWKLIKIGDIVVRKKRKAKPDNDSKLKFIGLESIESNSLKLKSIDLYKNYYSTANHFKKDNILYSRMRPNLNKVYKTEFDGVCSGEFFVLECLEVINIDFFKYLLHSSEFVKYATQKATGDRPRLYFKDFADYQFYIPKIEDQNLIVQDLDSRFTLIDNLNVSITIGLKKIEAFRKVILKKAFEGNLLQQNSNDKSANNLLIQIQIEKNAFLELQKKAKKNRPKMEKIIENKKTVLEILKETDTPISAHELWQQSINNEDIEEFYAELKRIDNKIEEIRDGMDIKLRLKL